MAIKNCPKCSAEMLNCTLGEASNRSFIQTAPFQAKFGLDRYLCVGCGFAEEWLNPNKLEKARETFKNER